MAVLQGTTAADLGRRTGVDMRTISALATGEIVEPSLATAFALERVVGIAADAWLAPGSISSALEARPVKLSSSKKPPTAA